MMNEKQSIAQMPVQMDLFNDDVKESVRYHPRPKNEPAKIKNTDASASAFGWKFQVNAGAVLAVQYIRDLDYVVIEGKTEDIEIYLENDLPIYAQAKAVQNDIYEYTSTEKANAALNTLINTSNRVGADYSKLLFIVNYRKPLQMSETLMAASWMPKENELYVKSYDELPEVGKKYIDDRIKAAQKQLKDGKYLDSIDNLRKDKLEIATLLMNSVESSSTKTILNHAIKELLDSLNIKTSQKMVNSIETELVNSFLGNASVANSSSEKAKMTKKELEWKFLYYIIPDIDSNYLTKKLPLGIEQDLEPYLDEFLSKQSQSIVVINSILSQFITTNRGKFFSESLIDEFIDNTWKEYKDYFPIDDDDDVQMFGVKILMRRVLVSQKQIRKFQKGIE